MDYVAIGYNTDTKKCCVIRSNATFEMLKDNFELYNTKITATSWGGFDDVDRACYVLEMKVNWDNHFKYNGVNVGYDSDHGHISEYTFKFDTVYELVHDPRIGMIKHVKNNPWEIELYDSSDEELQLAAIEDNPFSIRYIQNPTEKVQITAVKDMHSSFVYIMKPCQEVVDIIKSGWNADNYVIPRNISPDLEFSFYEPVYTTMEQIMFHLRCYINEKVKFFQYKSLDAAMRFLSKRQSWCFENGSRACSIDIRKVDLSNIESGMLDVLRERPDVMGKPYKEFSHGAKIEENYYLPMACGVEFCPDGHADYLVFEYENEYYIITILCFE